MAVDKALVGLAPFLTVAWADRIQELVLNSYGLTTSAFCATMAAKTSCFSRAGTLK